MLVLSEQILRQNGLTSQINCHKCIVGLALQAMGCPEEGIDETYRQVKVPGHIPETILFPLLPKKVRLALRRAEDRLFLDPDFKNRTQEHFDDLVRELRETGEVEVTE
jgi:hypothetical protein